MLTHGVLAAASYAYAAEVDAIAPGDALLHAAPMSQGSGVYMMATVARLGINVTPEASSFDAEEVLHQFETWPRTSMFAAPTMIKRLVECRAEGNPDHIRTIIWGGAPMYVADALKAIERFGPRFAQIYGQGEVPMTITTLSKQDIADREHPRWAERLGSAGRAYACFSNRPFWVKRFQTIHHYSVDVARGLALLFGIGTEALPAWDSKTRWNNL